MSASAAAAPVDSLPNGARSVILAGIRPMRPGDVAHVMKTWREAFKGSPTMHRKDWRDYKALHVPQLRACLDRRDTRCIVAQSEHGWPIGWLAFASWPSIDAVHWCHVSIAERRRGIATSLFDAAKLKQRVVYTHQGEVKRGGKERTDQWLSRWLSARGHIVSYTPYQEWAR